MPKITEYDPGNLALRPSEIGVEATAAAARRIGASYNQIAADRQNIGVRVGGAIKDVGDAATDFAAHQELNNKSLDEAKRISDLSSSWNEIARSNPQDPNGAAQKFRDDVLEPSLEEFQSGMVTQKGQAWAQSRADQIRQHFFTKTTSDAMSIAADNLHLGMQMKLNTATNNVYNDPDDLRLQMSALKDGTEALIGTSNLSGPQAAKVRNDLTFKHESELVHAAISGTIANGGDWHAVADKYPQYVNRAETETFAKAEQAQQRATRLAEKQMMDWNHTEMVRDGQLKLGKVFTDNVSYDETGKPVIKPDYFKQIMDVAGQNATAADHARTMLNWGEAQQNKKIAATSDPVTKQALLDRFTSDNPPSEVDILKAEANGKLSTQDGRVLRDLSKATAGHALSDPIYKATMDAVKGAVGDATPPGKARYATFFQNFIPAYLALPPEKRPAALNMSDPNSLISQTMGVAGKPGALAQTPLQQMLEKKSFGLIDPGVAAQIIGSGETIGGVKPTGIRTGGQQVGIPPAGEREVGKTYETPNGPRIWRGNGWEKP